MRSLGPLKGARQHSGPAPLRKRGAERQTSAYGAAAALAPGQSIALSPSAGADRRHFVCRVRRAADPARERGGDFGAGVPQFHSTLAHSPHRSRGGGAGPAARFALIQGAEPGTRQVLGKLCPCAGRGRRPCWTRAWPIGAGPAARFALIQGAEPGTRQVLGKLCPCAGRGRRPCWTRAWPIGAGARGATAIVPAAAHRGKEEQHVVRVRR
jgi:hypothetical protein